MKIEEIKQGQILYLKSDIEKQHPFKVQRLNKKIVVANIGESEKQFCISHNFLTQAAIIQDIDIRTNKQQRGVKSSGYLIKRNTIIFFENKKGSFYGIVRRVFDDNFETYFIYNGRLVVSDVNKKDIIGTLERGGRVLYRYNNAFSLC